MSTINIAMTSYPKRIRNCVDVINSVLANTIVPDRIYLTLAHSEFPNWEQDLPKDLYKLVMTSDRVVLNWVEENTKSFKKVFPILNYLEDDDFIIPIDDDMLIPKDLIESRLKDFHDNGDQHPITSNLCWSINMDNMVFTVYSLVQKKMLRGWEKLLTPTVLNTCNDDRTCLYLCQLNGYLLKPCTKYCYTQGNSNGVEKLHIAPRSNYSYQIGPIYDETLAPCIAQLSNGKTIGQCFGLFKELESKKTNAEKKVERIAGELSLDPKTELVDDDSKFGFNIDKLFQYGLKKRIKHDVVYVLGDGSKNNNLEIRISITSLLKFCQSWLGDIYVVGSNPGIKNENVHFIPAPDITNTSKDANIIYKLLTAIWKIPTLTDNFLFCSDDILVTRETNWEDFIPRYVFEYKPENGPQLRKESRNNEWDLQLLDTLDRFVGHRKHIYFYEPHIFAPINKKYFLEMCKQMDDYPKRHDIIIMSLWFNWLNLQNPPRRFGNQSVFTKKIPNMDNPQRHLTYNDTAFGVKKFKDALIDIVSMEEFRLNFTKGN